MTNSIKVAKLPGTVTEVAVEQGTTFAQVIEIAGQDSTGFEVKADGRTITNLNEVADGVSMILLAKQVKGNSSTLKVAKLPGTVTEIAVEDGTTFAEAIELAGQDSAGFEIKADGRTITNLNEAVGGTSMILLAKQVKGNAGFLKVAKLPGTVTEVAVEDNTTFREAIELAGQDSQGFEIKADGRTITNLDESVGSTSMVLLAKQVKGNHIN